MKLDNVKLSQLRALVAIAQHGNFSEAALHLEVSQSAISHAIATLETELGVIVLSRGRHGAFLTPVGERIVTIARQMLYLLESVGKEAELAKGLQGGQVRVASFRSVATHVLPCVIVEFRRRYPAIAITVTEYSGDDGIEEALRRGQADVGFTCISTSDEFEAWEILRDEYFVLLPPDADVPGESISWDDLKQYPLILPPDNDYCAILIYTYLSKLGHNLEAAYRIKEDSTLVGMVAQGLGATIIARLAAEPLPSNVQIRRLPVPLERVIRVATLARALHSPAVFAFLETLKQMTEAGQLKQAPRSNDPQESLKIEASWN
ncbi:LysR family transcriptional regulator [Oculatella sp. LEGE 06141]|uniref:LysR family transcriptional regulator n=1 Tax=Oculatella sp. LEGE 06141 TaxID=1828648 RepID=UPI00187EE76A|nr:LysR family transcriptional regulator [Oculatella sp. LEGE 06141]MBE9180544.1 LysR family transcriptional regulator [Oculatella sp. LEGE 06141]